MVYNLPIDLQRYVRVSIFKMHIPYFNPCIITIAMLHCIHIYFDQYY